MQNYVSCRNCLFEQGLRFSARAGYSSSLTTLYTSGQLLSRRPRLVRGLYLGKEPLEYQKTLTPFRFSFQKPNSESADKENDKVRASNQKTIFPNSMTVALCNLQPRPSKSERFEQKSVEMSISAGKRNTAPLLGRARNTLEVDRYPRKERMLLAGKKAKSEEPDFKQPDKVTKKGKMSPHFEEESQSKSENAGLSRSFYLEATKGANVSVHSTYQMKELVDYPKEIRARPYAEYGTFKLSDYDIWSRTNKK